MQGLVSDKYEILGILARGGMGTVYWGRTRPGGAPVVFKTVVDNVGVPRYLDREYRILSTLSHPNILQVYEKFVVGGNLWIAMERIDGVPLLKALPHSGTLRLGGVATRVFGQLQSALEYLHDHEVVHAELSPDNLLVDSYGVLKIVDFEHSRLLEVDESEYWPTGVIAGTPAYMSPEHLTGKPVKESDYFVVGTLLLQHISGRHPFLGSDIASTDIASVVRGIAKPNASHLMPASMDIDPQLRTAISSLLAEHPSDRHSGWEHLRSMTRHYMPFDPSPVPSELRIKGDPSVFISHSSLDKQLARRLALELAKRGVDVWLDEWAIQVGDSISRRVEEGLQNSTHFIFLLSPQSVTSKWVENEWRAALSREMAKEEVIVVPVLVAKCELPLLLRDRKYADMSESFERGLNELLLLLS